MDMSELFAGTGTDRVSLRKSGIEEKPVDLVISDGWYVDHVSGFLNNRDLLRMLGKAYAIGYTRDFGIFLEQNGQERRVLTIARNGDVEVNWDIVRVADRSEWFA